MQNSKLQFKNQKYEPVIGIEVHVELNTRTKMFCRCPADYFGKKPNTHTCPVCLGLPGALPYINEEAIKKCMQIGLALNCEINEKSYFERKNYFYPDLPKGYQISQYVGPLCVNGWMEIDKRGLGGIRRIRVNRVHQEEDTARLIHQSGISNFQFPISNDKSGITLIDFNRSGVPLVEIVTEPDFHSSSQVRDYAQKLREIFRHIGVSNADMERGDMRLEANVSLRETQNPKPETRNELPNYRVELKNINSFRFMVAAIEYEIKRQSEALERGEVLAQETRGWNENKKETFLQRTKEEAQDYRYFPEPDLPELRVKSLEAKVKEEIAGKLPGERAARLVERYGLTENQVRLLIKKGTARLFEEVIEGLPHFKEGLGIQQAANYIINRKVTPDTRAGDVVKALQSKAASQSLEQKELEEALEQVFSENQDAVENYKNGKEGVMQFLIGQVLKKTKGRGNPEKIQEKLVAKVSGKA